LKQLQISTDCGTVCIQTAVRSIYSLRYSLYTDCGAVYIQAAVQSVYRLRYSLYTDSHLTQYNYKSYLLHRPPVPVLNMHIAM